MKKIVAIVLSALLLCTSVFALSACDGRIRIAVLQFAQHGSLDNCYEGIVRGLSERGYTEENANITRHIANGDSSENTAAAQNIINASPAVAVGIATPSAYALANFARGDVPVVFTAVSDPIAESADFSVFENVTGSSDRLPVEQQLQLIRDFFDAKGETGTVTVGIVFTLTEANSVSQIAQFEAAGADYGVEIVTEGITNATELVSAAESLIGDGVDCFNNLTDNTVVQNLDILLDRADGAGIPVFGSEVEQVRKGCLASCSLDYEKLGRRTGLMIADILEGKDPDDIDYLYIEDGYTVDYNSDVLEAFGFTLPTGEDYQGANDVKA